MSGEEHQAADLQVAQVGAVADPDVEAGGEADQDGDGDVDVGQVDGAVAIEEQRVARRLAGHARRHGEEQIGEDRKGAAQLPAVQAKGAFREAQHGIRFSHSEMSERPSLLARLLRPIVQLRDGEATTALLMFLYSFLAMTSYNIIKPITRSEFISSLGADNLPYVHVRDGRADRRHHAGLHEG